MMAHFAGLSELVEEQTKKTAEMRGGRSQWFEPVLLQAWLKNLFWCPLPPDATSYLQEPDTHLHSQLKAEYRETKDTTFVVMDATALWLKLRGEEQVVACLDEVNSTRKLKGLKRKLRKAEAEEQRGEARKDIAGFVEENPQFVDKGAAAMYTSAGDKYRLTLINISTVKNWWKPGATPEPGKPKCILLVPAKTHCRPNIQ